MNSDDWGSPSALYALVDAAVLLLYSFGSLALVDIFEVLEFYFSPLEVRRDGVNPHPLK